MSLNKIRKAEETRPSFCRFEPSLYGGSRSITFCFFASDDFENHAVAIKNQHPVPTGITTFGAVLGLAFGADPPGL